VEDNPRSPVVGMPVSPTRMAGSAPPETAKKHRTSVHLKVHTLPSVLLDRAHTLPSVLLDRAHTLPSVLLDRAHTLPLELPDRTAIPSSAPRRYYSANTAARTAQEAFVHIVHSTGLKAVVAA
jgi:hypothetical protein